MLTTIFKGMLSASLSTAPVIFLLLAAMPFLRRHFRPTLLPLLWAVPVIRLLFPVTLRSTPHRLVIPAGDAIFYLDRNSGAVAKAFGEVSTLPVPDLDGVPAYLSLFGLFAMVWLTGAFCLLLAETILHFHTRRKLDRWCIPVREEDTLKLLEACGKKLGVRQKTALMKCGLITTPLLVGLWNPTILLPDQTLTESQTTCVLLHELAHVKRRDLWFKLLLTLVFCMHWFNPLVWLLVSRAAASLEPACDAAVLKDGSGTARREYGASILLFLPGGKSIPMLLSSGFFGTRRELLRRFEAIVDTGTKRKGIPLLFLTAAAVVVSAALVGFGTAAKVSAEQPSPSVLETTSTASETLLRPRDTGNSVSEAAELLWPVPDYYSISSVFGFRYDGQDFHTGIDISGDDIEGQPVIAAKDGQVIVANTETTDGYGYGQHVIIGHDGGIATVYAHLKSLSVKAGDSVKAGQVLGTVGNTGFASSPQLHFEVRENEKAIDPKGYLLFAEEAPAH